MAALVVIGSDNSKDKTAMAVTFAGTITYLYYLGRSGSVHRVVKDKNVWGDSKPVGNAQDCDASSDLAVTTANNVNHLFYQPKDAAAYAFAHFVDSL